MIPTTHSGRKNLPSSVLNPEMPSKLATISSMLGATPLSKAELIQQRKYQEYKDKVDAIERARNLKWFGSETPVIYAMAPAPEPEEPPKSRERQTLEFLDSIGKDTKANKKIYNIMPQSKEMPMTVPVMAAAVGISAMKTGPLPKQKTARDMMAEKAVPKNLNGCISLEEAIYDRYGHSDENIALVEALAEDENIQFQQPIDNDIRAKLPNVYYTD